MNFFSISQYFNKLQIVLLLLLIVPLLPFIARYVFAEGTASTGDAEYFTIISCAVLIAWLAAVIIPNKKIKSVRNAQGLGAKLEKYFRITIVRFGLLSAASLFMAVGLYVTGNDLFTAFYLGGTVLSFVFWPTSQQVCKDLRLKGDEREMVYFKKDRF